MDAIDPDLLASCCRNGCDASRGDVILFSEQASGLGDHCGQGDLRRVVARIISAKISGQGGRRRTWRSSPRTAAVPISQAACSSRSGAVCFAWACGGRCERARHRPAGVCFCGHIFFANITGTLVTAARRRVSGNYSERQPQDSAIVDGRI
jgi:hypothetical protein